VSRPHDVLVAAGVLVRDPANGAVLLQLRGDDATWGLPGGRLEPGETLEQAARRELLEETGLTAGDMTRTDVYSGPEFVVRYPDGYAAYVVGATFETSDVVGTLSIDDAGETAALAWYPVEQLPAEINAYNRMLLRRVGLNV
jgi:8-oxo-dGTP pyrophosphatase MutT (NUDIX family)